MDLDVLSVNVQVTHCRGKPALEFRKTFTDPEVIKRIVSSSWHDQGLTIIPKFADKVNALGSLIKIGILYKDKTGQYKFTPPYE